MNFVYTVTIDLYSIVLLVIMYVHGSINYENISFQHKLYIIMLNTTILMLLLDILSRFEGRPDTIYMIINHIGNFAIFLLNPVLPLLWLIYVYSNIFKGERKIKRLFLILLPIFVFNTAMVILTQFYGWYYYIDSNNIYHRGSLFLIASSISAVLVLISFIMLIQNRKNIKRKLYLSLIFVAVPPFLCVILQMIFYSVSIMLNSVALSLFVLSLNIQNHDIYTDYLTEINNRKKLDSYLNKKINASTEEKTFSEIMMDLNYFKSINDKYGHDEGDRALKIFTKLLVSSIKSSDFIARYGGDEFCVVLDTSDKKELQETINRINKSIEDYNKFSMQPYKIEISMGYAIYDYKLQMKLDEFQKMVDVLLYENKQNGKDDLS